VLHDRGEDRSHRRGGLVLRSGSGRGARAHHAARTPR
jgi:hypothetical protein